MRMSIQRPFQRIVGCGFLAGAFCIATAVNAQILSGDGDFRTETLTSGFQFPWSMTFLPDGRMLVTERIGQLRIVNADGILVDETVTGLPDDIFVSGQAGLKDVALAPDFESSQRLFLSYACGTLAANSLCLSSATFSQNVLSDVTEIFRTNPVKTGSAHYGGRIAFLSDETLVLTTGDGFDYREQAQNPASHLGKLIRLNQDGSVPDDNPFLNDIDTAPEVYSLGHRNPQGIVYDSVRQRLISHEHGPRGGDELNLISAGNNYGWPITSHGIDYTGAQITPFRSRPGMTMPIMTWTPSIAPSGMTLYDGDLFPQWRGDLFITALAGKALHRVRLVNDQVRTEEKLLTALDERLRDVRTGPDGAIYILTDNAVGRLLRLTPSQD